MQCCRPNSLPLSAIMISAALMAVIKKCCARQGFGNLSVFKMPMLDCSCHWCELISFSYQAFWPAALILNLWDAPFWGVIRTSSSRPGHEVSDKNQIYLRLHGLLLWQLIDYCPQNDASLWRVGWLCVDIKVKHIILQWINSQSSSSRVAWDETKILLTGSR
jgi:hypothetical protein